MVTINEVLAIHEQVVRLHGGSAGIRDIGGLESAIARPFKVLEETIYTQQLLTKLSYWRKHYHEPSIC